MTYYRNYCQMCGKGLKSKRPAYCKSCGDMSQNISLKQSTIRKEQRVELNGIDEALARPRDLRNHRHDRYEDRIGKLEMQRRPFCGCHGNPIGDCPRPALHNLATQPVHGLCSISTSTRRSSRTKANDYRRTSR